MTTVELHDLECHPKWTIMLSWVCQDRLLKATLRKRKTVLFTDIYILVRIIFKKQIVMVNLNFPILNKPLIVF